MRLAITRPVSPAIGDCELTFVERQPIDAVRAAAQHDQYEHALARHGCTVVRIAAAPELPDAVFVEDAAIVLDEIAVITRPGAESRQAETASVAAMLQNYRPLVHIQAPATIDGGDVLRLDRTLYVGRSQRTNEAALEQLQRLAPDYKVVAVYFRGCLHLKSAVTQIEKRTLLFNPDWIEAFKGFEMIAVDPTEPFAANALYLDGVIVLSDSHTRTRHRLEQRGYRVVPVDVSELEKAEAGVTCCSLMVERPNR